MTDKSTKTVVHLAPFTARKLEGIWCVVDSSDSPIIWCDCRCSAEDMLKEMTEHFYRERARHCGLTEEFVSAFDMRNIPFIDPNFDITEEA